MSDSNRYSFHEILREHGEKALWGSDIFKYEKFCLLIIFSNSLVGNLIILQGIWTYKYDVIYDVARYSATYIVINFGWVKLQQFLFHRF